MKAKTTNTTMEFTFTEEERKAIKLTQAILNTVKETMNAIHVGRLSETDTYCGFSIDAVECADYLLIDLLNGKIWEEDK